MLCPKCKSVLTNVYNEGLGWFPHYTGNGDREYQVFVVGHCEKCKSDWQWKDVDFMREMGEKMEPKLGGYKNNYLFFYQI